MESVTTTRISVADTPPLFDSDEMEILLGIAEGMSIKEIAKEHGKNERSLEKKCLKMKKKVHARTAAQLVAMAYHLGILIPRRK